MKTIYDRGFYQAQSLASSLSAQKIVPTVISLVHPRSVVDVGCGVGTWLECFRQNGIKDILGIDGEWVEHNHLLIPRSSFMSMNLSSPSFTSKRRFDLAVSLEVAEHLPPSSAHEFVQFLVSLAPVILFSAAIPGQGGASHVNEQWPQYWFELFSSSGYRVVDCIRPRIWELEGIQPWYAQNTFLYINESHLDDFSELLDDDLSFCMPIHLKIVHPDLFTRAARRPASGPEMFKELIRRLVGRLQRGFSRRLRRKN